MWLEIATDVLCLVLVLGALGAAAWEVVSGRAMEQGVDGLFLVMVCLVIAVLFSFVLLNEIRSGELRHLLKGKQAKAGEKEEKEKPLTEPATAEKSQGKS